VEHSRKGGLIKLLIGRLILQAHPFPTLGEGDMSRKSSTANDTGHRWFSDAIGGAWRLVKQGTKISGIARSPFHAELCALSAPHMPVLVHKRAKYLGEPESQMNMRWFSELEDFVTHTIWPLLFDGSVPEVESKSDIIEALDAIVASEQRRAAAAKAVEDFPHTSRFDTSWVT
jgi:hypothetical protein